MKLIRIAVAGTKERYTIAGKSIDWFCYSID